MPLKATTADDVPWLYWTAAAWGAELSLAPNQFARIAELAIVRALLNRAKALNDTWEQGAIYEALIAFDGLPPLLGGSPAAAQRRLRQGDEVVGWEVGLRATSPWRRRSPIPWRKSACSNRPSRSTSPRSRRGG